MKVTVLTTKLLFPLRSAEQHSSLGISPNELDLVGVAIVICFFIARTIIHAIGLGTSFKSANKAPTTSSAGQSDQDFYALPDISLSMPLRLNAKDQQVFAKAVRFQHTSTANTTANNAEVCLYLAALIEPAMLLMLAKRGCPIRPLGAVNVRNRFEILDQDVCKALFTDASNPSAADGLAVLAKFPRPARRVRRGVEVDIEVSIIANKLSKAGVKAFMEANPEGRAAPNPVFRQEFTILQFMQFRSDTATPSSTRTEQDHGRPTPKDSDSSHSIVTTVPMEGSAPHVWAQLCKDYNPIHFSPFLAKLLGQRGQLAHGNHAVGLCLQTLYRPSHHGSGSEAEQRDTAKQIDGMAHAMKDRAGQRIYNNDLWWMEVHFRRPIVLPAKIGVTLNGGGDGFEVVDVRTGKTSIEVSMGVA